MLYVLMVRLFADWRYFSQGSGFSQVMLTSTKTKTAE
jgi:hypothetical protein